MKVNIIPSDIKIPTLPKERCKDRFARKILFNKLDKIQHGQIIIREKGKSNIFGQFTGENPLKATLWVQHPSFYACSVFGGSVGAAEAYIKGFWSADDLTTLVRIMIQNQSVFEEIEKGLALFSSPFHRIYHMLRRNTLQGSQKNILAHYDLGNEFYELFLDKTLSYSCAIFENRQSSLEDACQTKYRRICQKLQLSSDDHVLEIGTGWGGFAIYAARHYGCRITTTTISCRQYKMVAERIRQENLTDKITLVCEDYRKIKGHFNKLVSVEMIEAVGHQYLDTFFSTCSQLLHEDGMMLLQAITIRDHLYNQHIRSVDFIKRYIFPGGCLPSVSAMTGSIARVTNLILFHLEDITPHYALTLRKWRERFFNNIHKVRAMKFPESFIRLWEYYLCYCEAGFTERYIGNVQMILTKPMCRRSPLIPQMVES